jgi:frataxin-like iron-binding protein CyaY
MIQKLLLIFSFSIFVNFSLAQEFSLIESLKKNKLTIIEINTKNQATIDSKEIYLKAGLRIYDYKNNTFTLTNDSTEIKGRGNSTWENPKKPYRLKLFTSKSLGGMPSNRHWALLANFEDKSASRTKLASDLGNYLGMNYTPRSIPVELVLNGEHLGSYQLIEAVKIAPSRIDITSVKTTNGITSGGVIFELNARLDEQYNFYSNAGLPISIKDPDDLNTSSPETAAKHFDYLVGIFNKAEDALFSSEFTDPVKGYPNFFNVTSAVNWYLTVEILRNFDIGEYSVYKYIDTKNNNKITYGPFWDFDLSAGNREGPIGFKAKVENAWMRRFFEDPNFESLVKSKWMTIRENLLSTMTNSINQNARQIFNSQLKNEQIWSSSIRYGDKSFYEDVFFLKNWLYERVQWLDEQFSAYPIKFSPVVQDAYFSIDEDVQLSKKLNASATTDSTNYFYLVKNPKKGEVGFLNKQGDFIYTPDPHANGVDSLYFSFGDSLTSKIDSGLVVIEINSINDAPVTNNAAEVILEDYNLSKSVAEGLKTVSLDVDGDPLTYEIIESPKNGVLEFKKDGSFTYSPNPNFFGLDSFTFFAADFELKSNVSKYTLNVLPVNDKPILKSDTLFYQLFRNEKLLLKSQEVLLNGVTDIDNTLADFSVVFDTNTTKGSIEKNGIDFIYKPNPNFIGLDSFSYKVSDNVDFTDLSTIKVRVLPEGNFNSFEEIVLYPNPSAGEFFIDNLKADTVYLFDMNGNKVSNFSTVLLENNIQIDARLLNNGEYILYLLYQNKVIGIKKLILNKN